MKGSTVTKNIRDQNQRKKQKPIDIWVIHNKLKAEGTDQMEEPEFKFPLTDYDVDITIDQLIETVTISMVDRLPLSDREKFKDYSDKHNWLIYTIANKAIPKEKDGMSKLLEFDDFKECREVILYGQLKSDGPQPDDGQLKLPKIDSAIQEISEPEDDSDPTLAFF